MDINRNQYFLAGLVLLLLGIQFRATDSVVLSAECVKFLGQNSGSLAILSDGTVDTSSGKDVKATPKTIEPPDWLGWALTSVGVVLILHSMAMKKPG